MIIALWVLLIHVIELAVVGAFLLIRRNNALEKAFTEQQQYIDETNNFNTPSSARKTKTNVKTGDVRLMCGALTGVGPIRSIMKKSATDLSLTLNIPSTSSKSNTNSVATTYLLNNPSESPSAASTATLTPVRRNSMTLTNRSKASKLIPPKPHCYK
jgi:hypothetical protein